MEEESKCWATFTGEGGYDRERIAARERFTIGEKYLITGGSMSQSCTRISFDGIEGSWNSVMFDYDESKAPIDNPYIRLAP